MRRVLILAFAFVFSGVLLVFAFRGVDFQTLKRDLLGFPWQTTLFLGGLVLLEYGLYVQRWRILLRPSRNFSFWQAAGPMLIGLGANFVLPARSGDVVRSLVLAKRYAQSTTAVLTTVGVEHLTNLFIVCCLALFGFLMVHPIPAPFLTIQPFLIGIIVALGLLLLLLVFFTHTLERIGRHALAFLPARIQQILLPFLLQLIVGFSSMKSYWSTAQVLLWGTLRWLLNASVISILLSQLGIPLSFGAGLIVVGVLSIAVIFPSAPAQLGPVQAGFWLALAPFGAAKSAALAASLAYTAVYFAMSVSMGLVALGAMSFSWPRVTSNVSIPKEKRPKNHE